LFVIIIFVLLSLFVYFSRIGDKLLTEGKSANQSEVSATMEKDLFAICALLCVAISSTIPREDGERRHHAADDDNNNNNNNLADDDDSTLRASDDVSGRKLRQRTRSHKHKRLLQAYIVFNHGDATPFDYDGYLRVYCPETGSFIWKKEMTELHPTIPLREFDFKNITTGELLTQEPIKRKYFLELYEKEKFLPGGARAFALTRKGMEECFELGKRIRKRYKGRLPITEEKVDQMEKYGFRDGRIWVTFFTANFQRTRLCLAYVISGVFPKNEEPPEKKHFFSYLHDDVTAQFWIRPSVTWKNWRHFYRTHAADFVQGYNQSSKTIASLCNTTDPPFWLHFAVTKMMAAWKANGLNEDKSQPANDLTKGVLPLLPDLQNQMHKLHLAKYIGDSRFDIDLKNLTAKTLLDEILIYMRREIRWGGQHGASAKPKMVLQSGFDVSMMPLMFALGIPFETTLPPTASLAFELYRDKSAAYPPAMKIPLGYKKGGDGNYYKYYKERRTWIQAHDFCHSVGGNLAIIYNQKTRDVVRQFMGYGWIGVTFYKGRWQTSTLDNLPYSSWSRGRPSFFGGLRGYQDCALQKWNKKWDNMSCRVKLPFICQFQQDTSDDSSDDSSDESSDDSIIERNDNIYHCDNSHYFDFVEHFWQGCNESMYHVRISYSENEEEEKWKKWFRLDELIKIQRKMTGKLYNHDVGAGFDDCENANFTLRERHPIKDKANAHCYGEKCIDVGCGKSIHSAGLPRGFYHDDPWPNPYNWGPGGRGALLNN